MDTGYQALIAESASECLVRSTKVARQTDKQTLMHTEKNRHTNRQKILQADKWKDRQMKTYKTDTQTDTQRTNRQYRQGLGSRDEKGGEGVVTFCITTKLGNDLKPSDVGIV